MRILDSLHDWLMKHANIYVTLYIQFVEICRNARLIIANIGKTLFLMSIKTNYSWFLKWIEWIATNLIFDFYLTAIINKGNWFIYNLISLNNSEYFKSLIEKLMVWLLDDLDIPLWKIVRWWEIVWFIPQRKHGIFKLARLKNIFNLI